MADVRVERTVCARIPTPEGEFKLCHYENSIDDKEHLALVYGDVRRRDGVLVRVHSECFTGDVLGSLRCDCGEQLHRAMQLIASEGAGVILYLRQEGRGIGLRDKLMAYNVQDEGFDTVEANLRLGHEADERDYTMAAHMLDELDVASIRLLTNNPAKIEALTALGIDVVERLPLQTRVHAENKVYLQTKVDRMRHLLHLERGEERLSFPTQQAVEALLERAAARAAAEERPAVTLSYAQSLDGCIALHRDAPYPISGPESLRFTHALRARHDGILVGVGTVLADDPQLTVRLVDGAHPRPIILDSTLRFPLDARLLHDSPKPWIFTGEEAPEQRVHALHEQGAQVFRVAGDSLGRLSLRAVLQRVAKLGVEQVMVEGGGEVIASFVESDLVDAYIITVAPLMVGGVRSYERTADPVLHATQRTVPYNDDNGHVSETSVLPRIAFEQTLTLGSDLVILGRPRQVG